MQPQFAKPKYGGIMNRHQRRSAKHQHATSDMQDGTANVDVPLVDRAAIEKTQQPGIILRVAAKILLSQWVLARVQHHDAERLLISLALEVGRRNVADALLRRQALRLRPPN